MERITKGFKPKWVKTLVDAKDFLVIENQIDVLLESSEKNLNKVSESDLY